MSLKSRRLTLIRFSLFAPDADKDSDGNEGKDQQHSHRGQNKGQFFCG